MDYDALAAKFGATDTPSAGVDYDALATQFGAVQDAPKKQVNTELTWAEKTIAPLLEKYGIANVLNKIDGGNTRGSAAGRMMMGAAGPGVAIAQLAANAVGQGDAVNKGIQDKEKQYQAARGAQGSTGFDPLRMAGNVGITLPVSLAGAAPTVLGGAMQGAAFSALEPVTTNGNFATEKAKQIGLGAAVGGAAAPAINAIGRLISPAASVNPELKLLQEAGVRPTIGQAAGGWANIAEQKAQSLPIMGDMITSARNKAKDQFNTAAINRALEPIGQKATGSGQDAIRDAGNALSKEYDSALSSINGVNFSTPTFNQNLAQLQQMSANLVPQMSDKFDKVLNNIVKGRMSPNGSMLPEVYKKVDSELGKLSAGYSKSQLASEKEFGDAVKQLKAILFEEVKTSNPQVAKRLAAADEGWANLVRLEGAAKAAKNTEGVFTPGQLNTAIQTADQSTRKRAVARGEALMQDLGNAGSKVLGNTYSDSGTAGRVFLGAGALGSGAISPAIPAALVGGAAAYSAPVQNALVYLLTKRPEMAPQVSNYLRQLSGPATVAGIAALEQP